eukprot:15451265-Alexandrium_andersonii.AAC.1
MRSGPPVAASLLESPKANHQNAFSQPRGRLRRFRALLRQHRSAGKRRKTRREAPNRQLRRPPATCWRPLQALFRRFCSAAPVLSSVLVLSRSARELPGVAPRLAEGVLGGLLLVAGGWANPRLFLLSSPR